MKKPILAIVFLTMILTFLIPIDSAAETPTELVCRKPVIKQAIKKKIPPKLKPVVKIKKLIPKLIIAKGVLKSKQSESNTTPQKKSEEVNIILSFYTSSVNNCGNDLGISASGKNLNRGSSMTYCAAPSNIPFGTIIQTENNTYQVEDRGGAIHYTYINGIKYMKIDVFVPGASEQELMDKGIVKTKGRILK